MRQYNCLEELMSDDRFVRWVTQPNDTLNAHWEQWLAQYPENRPLVEQARELIKSLQTDADTLTGYEIKQLAQRIQTSLPPALAPARLVYSRAEHTQSQRRVPHWLWAASLAAMLVLVTGVWWWQRPIAYSTDYGETEQVLLADGSMVTLNANSQLTYERGHPREVWLQGEAYFSIQRLASGQQQQQYGNHFVVHTDQLDIEVLGTAFNVNSRHGDAEVVLHHGKVNIIRHQEVVAMEPGDLVAVKSNDQQLLKKQVNPYQYTAWKDRQIVLEETPLYEIAQLLEDNYNYQVVFQDDALRNETFVGTFPADDIEVLLLTLRQSVPMHIDDDHTITFLQLHD